MAQQHGFAMEEKALTCRGGKFEEFSEDLEVMGKVNVTELKLGAGDFKNI